MKMNKWVKIGIGISVLGLIIYMFSVPRDNGPEPEKEVFKYEKESQYIEFTARHASELSEEIALAFSYLEREDYDGAAGQMLAAKDHCNKYVIYAQRYGVPPMMAPVHVEYVAAMSLYMEGLQTGSDGLRHRDIELVNQGAAKIEQGTAHIQKATAAMEEIRKEAGI